MTPEKFIEATFAGAMAMQKKYGIPAIAAMAQSALETGYGASAPGNMYFGVKADASWKGKTQLLATKEYLNGKWVTVMAKFRAYNTAQESFDDHGKFITTNARYKVALQNVNNPDEYIRQVAKAGYATDPLYASKIISIMTSLKKKLVLLKL